MPTRNRKGIQLTKRDKNINLYTNYSKYYSNPIWLEVRKDHLIHNPICECCLKHDRVSAGEHVHHIIPWDSGRTEEIKVKLLTDPNNLITLCKKCHYAIHEKINRNNLIGCGELTDEEYNITHGLNLLK